MKVLEWIIEWFEKNANLNKGELNIKTSYIEEGYVDSFGFIALISACEEKFNIQFSDGEFEDEAIFSISGIAQIIQKKLGETNE